MIALKNILVATDFSEPSVIALEYGRAMARTFEATLHIVHVVDTFLPGMVAETAPADYGVLVDELAGAWSGRVTNPAGHAAAAMTVAPDGAFRGMMYLDGGDREFRGGLVVVRPGEVRYRSTDGTGTVRVSDEQGRRVLKFFRDDGGVDAVFRR